MPWERAHWRGQTRFGAGHGTITTELTVKARIGSISARQYNIVAVVNGITAVEFGVNTAAEPDTALFSGCGVTGHAHRRNRP